MKAVKLPVTIFFASCLLATSAFADSAVLVIGQNLKVGMPLKDAIALLGIPSSVKVNRGTEAALDSIAVERLDYGVVIHALSKGTTVEAIEILPTFKGHFSSGVKIGDKFSALVEKYGMPQSVGMEIARYPELGLYFLLKDEILLSAKTFVKGSKLLESRLANPAEN